MASDPTVAKLCALSSGVPDNVIRISPSAHQYPTSHSSPHPTCWAINEQQQNFARILPLLLLSLCSAEDTTALEKLHVFSRVAAQTNHHHHPPRPSPPPAMPRFCIKRRGHTIGMARTRFDFLENRKYLLSCLNKTAIVLSHVYAKLLLLKPFQAN